MRTPNGHLVVSAAWLPPAAGTFFNPRPILADDASSCQWFATGRHVLLCSRGAGKRDVAALPPRRVFKPGGRGRGNPPQLL